MTQAYPIVFALYPNVTQLDFTGPLEVLARLPGAACILASERGGDLLVGPGMTLTGLQRLADIPSCQLLCVPGGVGTVEAIASEEYLREIARLGEQASTIVSICTGSLLLAAAGLLKGKRAACHWAWRDQLNLFGVQPDPARVVRDGKVVTGGGVTAGIDMALQVVADIAGSDLAESLQLALEYAPAPPFNSGRPELARPEILQVVQERMNASSAERDLALRKAAATLLETSRD